MTKGTNYIILIAIIIISFIMIVVIGVLDSKVPEIGYFNDKVGTLILVQGSAIKAAVQPSEIEVKTYGTMVDQIIQCESSGQHYDEDGNIKVGDLDKKYQSFGIGQYQIRTFNYLAEKVGMELDWRSESDQLWLLDWAIDEGYGCYWSCYQWITGECK